MNTNYKGGIVFLAAAMLTAGTLPAAAQTTEPELYPPQVAELTGSDVSCADAFAAFPSFPKSPRVGLPYVELRVTNPANASEIDKETYVASVDTTFRIDLLQDMSDNSVFTVTDTSFPGASTGEATTDDITGLTQSQVTDIPGYEAVILQRNNNAAVYFQVNMQGRTFDGPGTQTPTKITVCWALGPCGLSNQLAINSVCSAYNPSGTATENQIDLVRGIKDNHFDVTSNAMNVCGCTNPVRYCDPSVPSGKVGSCNLTGANFDGIETTSTVTSGVGTLLNMFGTTGDGTASDTNTDTAPTSSFTW